MRTSRPADAHRKWWPHSGQDFLGLNHPIIRSLMELQLEVFASQQQHEEESKKWNTTGAFRCEPYRARTAETAKKDVSTVAPINSSSSQKLTHTTEVSEFFGMSQTARFQIMQRIAHKWVQCRSKIEGYTRSDPHHPGMHCKCSMWGMLLTLLRSAGD